MEPSGMVYTNLILHYAGRYPFLLHVCGPFVPLNSQTPLKPPLLSDVVIYEREG